MTGSAKRALIADPNSTCLEYYNLTCEFATTLELLAAHEGTPGPAHHTLDVVYADGDFYK